MTKKIGVVLGSTNPPTDHPYGYCPGCKSHRKPHIHVSKPSDSGKCPYCGGTEIEPQMDCSTATMYWCHACWSARRKPPIFEVAKKA